MTWRLVVIPAVAALLGLLAGWLLARWLGPRAAWWLAGGLALAAGALILAGRGAQGMEGLGYVVVAILMAAPAGLGAALGGLAVHARR